MKIVLVLVPSPDCWRERPLGTSTKTGFKGLINHSLCEHNYGKFVKGTIL